MPLALQGRRSDRILVQKLPQSASAQLSIIISLEFLQDTLLIFSMISKKRILPRSLRPRVNFYSHIFSEDIKSNDTLLNLKEKTFEKSEEDFLKILAEIFRSSIYSIISAEEFCKQKHPKILRSIIPNQSILETKNFSTKIEILGNSSFFTYFAEHPIQKYYIFLFEMLRNIFRDYSELLTHQPSIYKPPNSNHIESPEEKIYQTILDCTLLQNDYFRNNFLTKILILQIPTENLKRMSNPTPRVPSDPALREKRARSGGDASNFGEHILFKEILIYLKENRPKTDQDRKERKSIPKLHAKNVAGLELILENYRETYLNKKDSETGKIIRYGKKLKSENLLNKFREWNNNSDEFKNEITKHHFPLPEEKIIKK